VGIALSYAREFLCAYAALCDTPARDVIDQVLVKVQRDPECAKPEPGAPLVRGVEQPMGRATHMGIRLFYSFTGDCLYFLSVEHGDLRKPSELRPVPKDAPRKG